MKDIRDGYDNLDPSEKKLLSQKVTWRKEDVFMFNEKFLKEEFTTFTKYKMNNQLVGEGGALYD